MKISSAKFIISAAAQQQFPQTKYAEIAFAGKSNVGKSTLINSLLNRKHLVKTSSVPGKTRLINFFLINDEFSLVDLPGYGFANVPRAMQDQWQELVESYLSQRACLNGVILIIDVRHGPTAEDLQLQQWLSHYQIPTLVVANKVDKLKRSQVPKHLKNIEMPMGLSVSPVMHSSIKRVGRHEIWQALLPWLN